ncbi:EF-hand domain-containing protein [Parazoarcus communis]|nr:EF-hand domain-containing protein [Parazoarcus communis]
MTSAISSSGMSYANWASAQGSQAMPRRPDASRMSEDLFSKLDTKSQGYLEQSDFETALSGLSDTSASAEELFTALDSNEDGKVTQDELSSRLQQLGDQLDSQFQQMRMAESGMGAMGGMPPPPPPPQGGEDSGLSQDELTTMASEASNSNLASMFSALATNFDTADADGDGLVSASEARAYGQSQQTSSTSASAGSGGQSVSSEARLLKQIMDLAASYGSNASASISGSLLSASA